MHLRDFNLAVNNSSQCGESDCLLLMYLFYTFTDNKNQKSKKNKLKNINKK